MIGQEHTNDGAAARRLPPGPPVARRSLGVHAGPAGVGNVVVVDAAVTTGLSNHGTTVPSGDVDVSTDEIVISAPEESVVVVGAPITGLAEAAGTPVAFDVAGCCTPTEVDVAPQALAVSAALTMSNRRGPT